MDLDIIISDWTFDDKDENANIRKIVGIEGRTKLQIRLPDGLIQWELEGRPDGRSPFGFESVLAYCHSLINDRTAETADTDDDWHLDEELLAELDAELLSYTKRRMVLFKMGDYVHALRDALHALAILEVIRDYTDDDTLAFHYDRHRPQVIADKARARALLEIRREQLPKAVSALNRGIRDIEEFFTHYDMESQTAKSQERRLLIDLRRSLRERYSVPLTDDELLEALKAEQQVAVLQENYEMAARLRDKISLVMERIRRES